MQDPPFPPGLPKLVCFPHQNDVVIANQGNRKKGTVSILMEKAKATHSSTLMGLHCCKGFPLVEMSRGYSCWSAQASHSGGFSHCQAWALGVQTSVVGACGFSCSAVCGILLDQGSNLRPLHWQVDSYPLCHQGKPSAFSISILGLYFYLISSSDLWH